ncbi:hypothetical protein [Rosistilla oblonga]|uniref:hypothetical protein n=1 Tax=Rosistilla oblonga TaxID=2527990 RepID=UPI003A97B434
MASLTATIAPSIELMGFFRRRRDGLLGPDPICLLADHRRVWSGSCDQGLWKARRMRV